MKLRLLRLLTAVPAAGLLVTFQPSVPIISAHALNYSSLNSIQKRLLSGFATQELAPANAQAQARATRPNTYFPTSDDGCPTNIGGNIKVNQNCLNISDADLQGRGQAQNETAIAQDPLHPENVVATYNDYRRGDGNCYGSFSRDGGRTWTDTTIPMSFTRGAAFNGKAREYWQAGGDTSVAWDTKGNAYFDCQVFNRGEGASPNPDQSSAIYLFRSTKNGGASWNFPGRPAKEFNDVAGVGKVLEDKPYMTVDNHVGSPFQDRIYVVYTEFAADGSAYIFETYSNDYGETFSPRHLVSIDNPLCTLTFGAGTPLGNCNENQFADPFTSPDGTLYIAFDNFNNATKAADNRTQVFVAKSTDGGSSFAVTKASDYYDLPDCATYQGGQDNGRACVPEKGSSMNSVFRATNYPAGSVNPENPSQIIVTIGSYINRFSNESNGCVPAGLAGDGANLYTGVKTPGACNNKILLAVSNDSGATFTGTTTDPRNMPTVNTARQAGTDQYWQWAAFNKESKLAVSYFDRQYGNDEFNGSSDISLSGSARLDSFGVRRVTSSSMPAPTQFPDAQGNSVFYGDYSGLTAVTDALPLWMDTRSPDLFLCPGTGTPPPRGQTTGGTPPHVCTMNEPNGRQANDQDVFTAKVAIPSGEEDNGDNGGGGGGDKSQ